MRDSRVVVCRGAQLNDICTFLFRSIVLRSTQKPSVKLPNCWVHLLGLTFPLRSTRATMTWIFRIDFMQGSICKSIIVMKLQSFCVLHCGKCRDFDDSEPNWSPLGAPCFSSDSVWDPEATMQ